MKSAPNVGETNRSVIGTRLSGSIGWIILDDAEHRNALGPEMIEKLVESIAALEADPAIRAIVIRSSGDHFCGGADIAVFDLDVPSGRDFLYSVIGCFRRLEQCRKPTIAAVRGLALGGGFELAIACDLIVATVAAQFGLPEVRVGAIPGYGILRLPELIGRPRAKMLMWSGERLSAEDARDLGLVAAVVQDTELEAAAGSIAEKIASGPRVAVELIKAGANSEIADRALFETTTAAALTWGTAAMREGARSFFEKRPPNFPIE